MKVTRSNREAIIVSFNFKLIIYKYVKIIYLRSRNTY